MQVLIARLLVQHITPGQHLVILTATALRRVDEADTAVAVFAVVPTDKIANTAASTSTKPSLGHCGQYYRLSLLTRCRPRDQVMPKSYNLLISAPFPECGIKGLTAQRSLSTVRYGTLYQCCRPLAISLLVNLSAHALAVVNILDQIQVVILPADRR